MRERHHFAPDGPDLKAVSDDQLLRGLFAILKQTRHDEADLVAYMAEVDGRKLYARQAAPSMFAWCAETLHLSEAEAYLRIAVARASRRHPMLLAMLADGRLHVSGIERLAPHLTEANREVLLKRAVHKTRRQIEELVAELAPRPAAATKMRMLPTRRGLDAVGGAAERGELRPDGVTAPDSGSSGAPGLSGELRPNGVELLEAGCAVDGVASAASGHRLDGVAPRVSGPHGESRSVSELRPGAVESAGVSRPKSTRGPEPIGPRRYRLQFDLDAEFKDELERLQALVGSEVPDGDLAKVVRLAVTRELERREARRFARTKTPRRALSRTDTRAHSRHIPAAVRRFVSERDGDRCTYRDTHGRRCSWRHDLEFHHVRPFGLGGDHSPEGIVLLCRTHNQLLAEEDFGKEKMARHRRRASRDTKAVEVVGARNHGSGGSALRQWRSTG